MACKKTNDIPIIYIEEMSNNRNRDYSKKLTVSHCMNLGIIIMNNAKVDLNVIFSIINYSCVVF